MHVAAAPAGLYAATGGDDGRVVVWLVESKMQVGVGGAGCLLPGLPLYRNLLVGSPEGAAHPWQQDRQSLK